jgi:hypothetical protein
MRFRHRITRLVLAVVHLLRRLAYFRETRIIRHSRFFNADWYMARHPDLRARGYDPALHYLVHGARQPLDPGPDFNAADYLRATPLLARRRLNPLLHYLATHAEALPWQEVLARDVAAARQRLDLLQEALRAERAATSRSHGGDGAEGLHMANTPAMRVGAPRPVSVVILGSHSADWMQALDPTAPVWDLLPGVARVTMAQDDPAPCLRADAKAGLLPVVIPLMEPHIRSLPPGVPSLAPHHAALELLSDKLVFDLFARDFAPDDVAPHYASAEEVRFPCVVKPSGLNATEGVMVAHGAAELATMMQQPAEGPGMPKSLQGYVPGRRDYATYAVCRSGRILWHLTYEFAMPEGAELRRPDTCCAIRRRATPPPMLDFLRRLTAALRFDGPLNVDYRIAGGGIRVFEVNPRLGGSLMRPGHVADLAGALATIINVALAGLIECPPASSAAVVERLIHRSGESAFADQALAQH